VWSLFQREDDVVVSLRRRLIGSIAAVLTLVTVVVLVPPSAEAVSPNLVISQVYGGGGNTGAVYTHDFIELFNRGTTPVSLNGRSVQYASATGTGNLGANSGQLTELPNVTLAPGQYYLIQEGAGAGNGSPLPAPDLVDATPIAMAAGAGKVAVVDSASSLGCNGGSTACTAAQLALIVDLVGYGNANFFEGSGPAPTLTNSTAALRINDGFTDTDNNAADFTAGTPTPRNSTDNDPVVASCGGPLSTVEGFEARRTVTASDADGRVVDIAITSVAPSPDPGSITLGPVTPAGADGGTASAVVIADADVPLGTYTVAVNAANDDATPQSGSCTLTVNVVHVRPIGEVQGSVADGADGLTHRSPFAPTTGTSAGSTTVAVRAVIYERTLAKTSAGASQFGILLQNTAATADVDPNSSDGIFVFMGSFSTLLRSSGGAAYTPQVGDEIVLAGRVSEFFNLTQLSAGLTLVDVERSGVSLNDNVPAFEVDPPEDLAASNRYWERREGMRAQVPANSLVVDSRDVFPSTADSEVWLIRDDHPVALRPDPFARRVFRDPHPLDNQPAPLFDDGNGYRFILGGFGLKASTGDINALLAPARTFDTVTNSPVGGVYFSFNKYQVMVEQQLVLSQGVDPSTNAPPQAFDRNQRFSIAPYNVENLYDFRDDPFDGCDFVGNTGCPGVSPPFDYVPANDAAYQAHLTDLAHQIAEDMHAPDIVMIQEAEDQDICAVATGALVCGATNNADGRPDTLQELALAIEDVGGPAYDAAYDRDGADDRGIVAAFLFRTDRVELLPARADDPVLGSSPAVVYDGTPLAYNTDVENPKVLNADLPDDLIITTGQDGTNVFTRAPQVGLFRVWREEVGDGTSFDLYAISNHFSSTPDARVEQRREQAAYDAAIVDALQGEDEDVRVAVGGDFNVYPRPDDGVAPGHPLFPSDQLGPLYDQGLENLWNVLVDEVPSSAYSYIFQGQTQTLDQIFLTPSLQEDLTVVRSAHVNADWPADFDGDVARGASDHDPLVAVLCRDETAPTLSVTVDPDVLWPPNHMYVTVEATITVSDDADLAPDIETSATSNEPDNAPGKEDGNTVDDIVVVDDDTLQLRAERSKVGTGRIYTITFEATDSCGNSTEVTATVTVPLEI
jgi:predicted extracellular nuclease